MATSDRPEPATIDIAEGEVTPLVPKAPAFLRQPLKAALIQIMSLFSFALTELSMRYIFLMNKDETLSQLLVLRCFLVVLMVLIMLNRNVKKEMFTIPPGCLTPLLFRVLQGTFSVFVMAYSVNTMPLVIVGLFVNLQPLLIVMLASVLLGERMHVVNVLALVITIVGVSLVVAGEAAEQVGAGPKASAGGVLLLFFSMCMVALGNIAMKQITSYDPRATSAWISVSITLVSALVMLAKFGRGGFTFILHLSASQFFVFCCAAFGQLFYAALRIYAMRYDQVSNLQIYAVLAPALMLLFDMALFDLNINPLIAWGLAIIVLGCSANSIFEFTSAKP